MDNTSERKHETENTKQSMIRMNTNDDRMMTIRLEDDHHHHGNDNNHHDHDDDDDEYPTRRPLKTLELFPNKDKTSLKEDLFFCDH